jgi:hypothetical protein
MCHEYEAWWWQAEDAARKRGERPSPTDIAKPKPRPETAAAPRPEVKAGEKELVPAE